MNAMPRVMLAPIFMVWFGLGIWSKVALGVTLVFFIVFFNVYQGVKEVSPVVLNNARMLGANRRQLLRTSTCLRRRRWVFSSLHTSVGMAFVGAVVGEYLGSAGGVGYLILQAEGAFDINTVFAGILVLTAFALVLDFAVDARREAACSSGVRRRARPSSSERATRLPPQSRGVRGLRPRLGHQRGRRGSRAARGGCAPRWPSATGSTA